MEPVFQVGTIVHDFQIGDIVECVNVNGSTKAGSVGSFHIIDDIVYGEAWPIDTQPILGMGQEASWDPSEIVLIHRYEQTGP